jgi:hypothetical protein
MTYVGFLKMVGPLAWLVDAWDIVARQSRYPSPAEKVKKALKRKD